MPYIKYDGDEVLKVMDKQQLLVELRDVEVPDNITAAFLKKHNIAELAPFPTPPSLKEDKYNKVGFEYKKVKGKWTREAVLIPVDEKEVEKRWTDKCNEVRNKRNALLAESDWTQLEDIDKKVRDKYKVYRQQLRDITNQDGFPFSVVYPAVPEKPQ